MKYFILAVLAGSIVACGGSNNSNNNGESQYAGFWYSELGDFDAG